MFTTGTMWTRAIALSTLLVTAVIARGGRVFTRGGHHYPQSSGSGISGRHTYPQSRGLSGQGSIGRTSYKQTTITHNHYYHPPQQIHYTGYSPQSLPVYYGHPPVYVYQYKDSGSRFNMLLAGLALYNLGRMSSSGHHYDNARYRSNSVDQCRLGIRRDNGDYEETRVDCQIMTSFCIDADTAQQAQGTVHSRHEETSVVVDGVVVNKTVVDAIESKGPPIQVTARTQCYLIRVGSVNMKKTVPCGLLQTYAQTSFSKAGRSTPVLSTLVVLAAFMVFY